MRGLSLVLLLAGSPALADNALISITFGADRIEIAPGELKGVEVMANALEPRLVVTLDQAVAPRLSALTGGHVGQEGAIAVCGQVVSRPVLRAPVTEAVFAITDPDPAAIHRLADILLARDCAPNS